MDIYGLSVHNPQSSMDVLERDEEGTQNADIDSRCRFLVNGGGALVQLVGAPKSIKDNNSTISESSLPFFDVVFGRSGNHHGTPFL